MQYTVEQIRNIVNEAKEAAAQAADEFENKYFPDGGWGACGFAWVDIWGIKGNTKLGREERKAIRAMGLELDYTGKRFSWWNPSQSHFQNIDCKEAGAQAAATVLQAHGFDAYAGSRLD